MGQLVSVLPSLKVSRIKDEHFIYSEDLSFRRSTFENISRDLFETIQLIQKTCQSSGGALELTQLKKALGSKRAKALQQGIHLGFIELISTDLSPKSKVKNSESLTGYDRYFCRPTFFNVPSNFPDEKSDVAILGLPMASQRDNFGVESGVDLLRGFSANSLDWANVCNEGVYSEIGMSGRPRHLCKKIVPKDFGNVGASEELLSEVVKNLNAHWENFFELGLKPLFIGGDHAITLPILWSLNNVNPSCLKRTILIHLDAHNDCFTSDLNFNHASVIANVLDHLPVRQVISLGLRSNLDARAEARDNKIARYFNEGRLKQYGMYETRLMLQNPARLKALIPKDSLVYFTFDIDFVCSKWVEGAVWTPMPEGADWSEVHRCIDILSEHVELVGADIVEFNPTGKMASHAMQSILAVLVHLIDALGKKG